MIQLIMDSDWRTDSEEWAQRLSEYDRVAFLGRGGTATVYSATTIEGGTPVAIKVFDEAEGDAFSRQLRAAERLDAVGGVVPLLRHATLVDGRAYMVFPYISGGSMADRMERSGAASAAEVSALGAAVASSLHDAHLAGVLHRDLKPSNVLIDTDARPLLADFGASSSLETETASATIALTIAYAAPEVLEGATADERSDVYSLGLTLLALATGKHPFGGFNNPGLAKVINQICGEGVPDPEGFGVPEGLAAVLRRATALDPDDRYRDAAAFTEALAAVRDRPNVIPDGSMQRHRVAATSATTSTPSRGRRARWVAMTAAVVVAAVVGGAGLALHDDAGDSAAQTTEDRAESSTKASTPQITMTISTLGEPVTEANGILGALYAQDDFAYAGLLGEECGQDDRRVAIAIHADQNDRIAGIAEPWTALAGTEVGVLMAYLPCEAGGGPVRYVLRAPGRWFVTIAQFPEDQYDLMVGWMRENETSPAPDYTVDEAILATLSDPGVYEGWAIIDRAK